MEMLACMICLDHLGFVLLLVSLVIHPQPRGGLGWFVGYTRFFFSFLFFIFTRGGGVSGSKGAVIMH